MNARYFKIVKPAVQDFGGIRVTNVSDTVTLVKFSDGDKLIGDLGGLEELTSSAYTEQGGK